MTCTSEDFVLSFLLSLSFLSFLASLFIHIHTKYYVKFIVVSNSNSNDKLKIHTKPLSLTKAIERVEELEQNYYWQEKEVFILKFNKFFWPPWKIYDVGKHKI